MSVSAALEPPPASVAEDPAIALHRWTRVEFFQMVEKGLIEEGARVELLSGNIVDMPVQSPSHSYACEAVEARLRGIVERSGGCYVRSQRPLALEEHSSPEPDVAVVAGGFQDYRTSDPTAAKLIVEVSDATLRKDRTVKLRLYARCGIPEYWIVNLPDAQLEIYRQPSGDAYAAEQVLRAGDSASPLFAPGESVAVADLLP